MKYLITLLVAATLAGCEWKVVTHTRPSKAITVEWPLGTVLVSRNNQEDENKSPGYQNHLAIYVGQGEIIEAQNGDLGVISTPFETYKSRDYTWFPLFPLDEAIGIKAATKARGLVGLPYRELSSLLGVDRNEAKGLNCVSVVRTCYAYALGHSLPGLKIPDDVLEMKDVFTRDWVYNENGKVVPLKKAS